MLLIKQRVFEKVVWCGVGEERTCPLCPGRAPMMQHCAGWLPDKPCQVAARWSDATAFRMPHVGFPSRLPSMPIAWCGALIEHWRIRCKGTSIGSLWQAIC